MIIDQLTRSIQLKICYFGPALSGKTTTIKSLFSLFGKSDKVLSIDSSIRRMLFLDYGTIDFENQQWHLKIHLYSTTEQEFYLITRPITLQGIDGVIFVADSQQSAYDRNLTSWNGLCGYFEDVIITLPIVIAFNKQDLPDKLSFPEFLENINYFRYKNIDFKKTTAVNGKGILDCFEEILSLVFRNLYRYQIVSMLGFKNLKD